MKNTNKMNPIDIVKQYFPWVTTILAETILWDCLDWKSCLSSRNIEANLRQELDKVVHKTWAICYEDRFVLRICGKLIYAGTGVNMPAHVKESIDNFWKEK